MVVGTRIQTWIAHMGAQHVNHYPTDPSLLYVAHNRGLIIPMNLFDTYTYSDATKQQESMEFMVGLNF